MQAAARHKYVPVAARAAQSGPRTRRDRGRFLCTTTTGEATTGEPTFASKSLVYSRVKELKTEQVGRCLERFKNLYEEPFAAAYASVKAKLTAPDRIAKVRMAVNLAKYLKNEKAQADAESKRKADEDIVFLQKQITAKLQDEPVTLSDFVEGSDPRVAEITPRMADLIRLQFPSSDSEPFDDNGDFETEVEEDKWWMYPFQLTAENAWDDVWKMPETEASWRWQHAVPPVELARWIAIELDKYHGFPNVNHKHPLLDVEEAKRKGTYRYSKRLVEKPAPTTPRKRWAEKQAEKAALRERGVDLDAKITRPDLSSDSPAVTPYVEQRTQSKPAAPKLRRTEPTDERPFSITTVQLPFQMIKDERIILMQRKVVLKIKVSALKLPPPVEARLKELAGDRYNASTGVLKLVADQRPRQAENKAHVLGTARALLHEAWKADLNYIPPPIEPIAPHLRVEKEIFMMQRDEARAAEIDPARFVQQKQFVTFKFPLSYPDPKLIAEQNRERASRLMKELEAL